MDRDFGKAGQVRFYHYHRYVKGNYQEYVPVTWPVTGTWGEELHKEAGVRLSRPNPRAIQKTIRLLSKGRHGAGLDLLGNLVRCFFSSI